MEKGWFTEAAPKDAAVPEMIDTIITTKGEKKTGWITSEKVDNTSIEVSFRYDKRKDLFYQI